MLLIYFGRFSPPPVRSKNARYQIVDAIKPNPNHLERSTIKSSTATTLSNNKKPILKTEPEPEYEYYYEYIYEEGLCAICLHFLKWTKKICLLFSVFAEFVYFYSVIF